MDEDAEPGRNHRFFCHRCIVEFEDDVQRDTCSYCGSGFIEQIDNDDAHPRSFEEREQTDAETGIVYEAGTSSNFNELSFLMHGARMQHGGETSRQSREEMLVDHLVWMTGANRGRPTTSRTTPFQFVVEPGDYLFPGEGVDALVTQFLGQLENAGPPPLPTEQISTIPSELVTAAQVEANMSCCVCWDVFALDESVSSLECAHIFHQACINPWLKLHATCPICRHSLLHAEAAEAAEPAMLETSPAVTPASQPGNSGTDTATPSSSSREPYQIPSARAAAPSTSSSVTSLAGLWAQHSPNPEEEENARNSPDPSSDTDVEPK